MDWHCWRGEEQDISHRHWPPEGGLPLLVGHRLCWQPWDAGDQNGPAHAKTRALVQCKNLTQMLPLKRVTVVVECLGWVVYDFGHSTLCLVAGSACAGDSSAGYSAGASCAGCSSDIFDLNLLV